MAKVTRAEATKWEMSVFMITALFPLLYFVIGLFKWAIILKLVHSGLAAFGVFNTGNNIRNRVIVWIVADVLDRATEPVLRPVRRWCPNFGNIDYSPVVVIVVLWLLQDTLMPWIHSVIVSGAWKPLLF